MPREWPNKWQTTTTTTTTKKKKEGKKREACGIQDMEEYPVFQGGTIEGGELERVGGGRG